jgi:DNA-binding MarR family transcriptional regulator
MAMSKSARAAKNTGPRQARDRSRLKAAAAPAFELADRLHSVAIHLLRRLRREDTAAGLPAPQLSALSVIVFRGPITLGELAQAEQVRPPTMTRVVAALEQAGLVKRSTDPADRRVSAIRATDRGTAVLAEGRLRRVEVLTRELEALSAHERATLAEALAVLELIVGARQQAAAGRIE